VKVEVKNMTLTVPQTLAGDILQSDSDPQPKDKTSPDTSQGSAQGAAGQPAEELGGLAALDGFDSAAARDRHDWSQGNPTIVDYLRHAHEKSGRHPFELVREFYRLHKGIGKLTWSEYVQYGVYDTARHDAQSRARFITNTLHWPIVHSCCDMTWQAVTEDKWLSSRILSGSSARIPETLAVIDRSDRNYLETQKISTSEELRAFLTSRDLLPVFGKENRGICSFGAFEILEADDRALTLNGEGTMSYGTFMERFAGDTVYLIQSSERNHTFFDRYTDGLATVRICILNDGSQIKFPFAVLKIPARAGIADNFWRPGNLACNVQVDTGEILTVRTKNRLGTTDYDSHPESGAPLRGETLPHWESVLQMARDCSHIFEAVPYQSMDIAISQDGPVLIEVNTGGGFDLPQLASGEGFLTDDVVEFFRKYGCEGF
jgi:hypothetical protein